MELPKGFLPVLKNADKVVVLTGAGMSAESGVPTFRDAQTGLWEKYKPEELATAGAFHDHPRTVWDWYSDRRDKIQDVSPHAGHISLVDLQQYFESFLLVTQNVDGLHQQAGSTQVLELHGNIMRSKCSETGRIIDEDWIKSNPGRPPVSPYHPRGLARPDVVWFGEALPENAIKHAMNEAANCDLFFSIGTSGLVQPAASLPFIALESGAVVIEINPTKTSLSSVAQFSFSSNAVEALTAISAALRQ